MFKSEQWLLVLFLFSLMHILIMLDWKRIFDFAASSRRGPQKLHENMNIQLYVLTKDLRLAWSRTCMNNNCVQILSAVTYYHFLYDSESILYITKYLPKYTRVVVKYLWVFACTRQTCSIHDHRLFIITVNTDLTLNPSPITCM